MKKIYFVFLVMLIVFSFAIAKTKSSLSNQPVEISAENFEVDINTNQFVAKENVLINQGELEIESKKATYTESRDRIVLYNDIKMFYNMLIINCDYAVYNRKNYTVTAKKNLKVKYKDFDIKSNILLYDIEKAQIYFEGKTIIKRGSNIINGSDIIFDMNTQKIYSQQKTKFFIDEIE